VTDPNPMRLAQDDRADLADFLAELAPEQWDAPHALRQVVGARCRRPRHQLRRPRTVGFARRLAAGRFNPDQANQVGVDQHATLSPNELLARSRATCDPPA
jgi:hypothetical protein